MRVSYLHVILCCSNCLVCVCERCCDFSMICRNLLIFSVVKRLGGRYYPVLKTPAFLDEWYRREHQTWKHLTDLTNGWYLWHTVQLQRLQCRHPALYSTNMVIKVRKSSQLYLSAVNQTLKQFIFGPVEIVSPHMTQLCADWLMSCGQTGQ